MTELNTNTLKLEDSFDLLNLHRCNPQRYPYLLESVVHGQPQARYDILFAFPGQTIESNTDGFLSRLDQAWSENKKQVSSISLPFKGGWFLYLGYELAAEIEPKLSAIKSTTVLPTAFATHIPAAVIRDHYNSCTYLVCEPACEGLLQQMSLDIAELVDGVELDIEPPDLMSVDEDNPQVFLNGVKKIRNYIREGDVFQVNLSREWRLDVGEYNAIQIYQRLRKHNPAPFAALVNYQNKAIISSSPERLIQVHGDIISTRPIAGTRPRGQDQDSDQAYSETLMAHPKERAEHVMLIDLERNDLGRVCQPGSVEVDELMVLESYAHVHHIVSNVRGCLREGVSPGDIIRAVFPGGTITGCPKVHCMEIIHELEQTTRGPYTGSVGYLNHNGNMDLNILIRTMLYDNGQIVFRTGAGIVADSVPENELLETRAKALGLLNALGIEDHVPH